MRRFFDISLLFAVLLGSGFVFLDQARVTAYVHTLLFGPPCAKPETYSLGTLDPRFHLSESDALGIVEQAAKAWNNASGKDLLEYVPQGGQVTINFQYDRRQALTQQLNGLSSSIAQSSASYQGLKDQYDAQKSALAQQKAQLDAQSADYAQALKHYNDTVDTWNAEGGAPPSVVRELDNERQSLQWQATELQQKIDAYNAAAEALNTLAQEVNAQARSNNSTVATYNTLAGTTGSEFTEGEYSLQGGVQQIEVYQYSSENKLLRVIEHEFGHSLGLEHVSDTGAIMYPQNSGSSLLPTTADLAELARVCAL